MRSWPNLIFGLRINSASRRRSPLARRGVLFVQCPEPNILPIRYARFVRGGTQVIRAGTVATAAEKQETFVRDGPALSKPYDHRAILDHIKRLLAAWGFWPVQQTATNVTGMSAWSGGLTDLGAPSGTPILMRGAH